MKTCLRPLQIILLLPFIATAQASLSAGYKAIEIDSSYEHLAWGIEPHDKLYHFAAFVCSFDTEDDNNGDGSLDRWGIPEWVAYEVKKKGSLEVEHYSRPKWMTVDSLHELNLIPEDASYHVKGTRDLKEVKDSYRFVRGHLCPKETADRISMAAGWNTHTFLNALPQLQWQNNGPWKKLEADILKWADTYERVWVITGPVFFSQNPSLWLGQEGEVKVAVPDAIFKIVIRASEGATGVECLSFIIPNILPKSKSYPEYLCSLGYLSERTGLTFLSKLPLELRNIEYSKYQDLSISEKKAQVDTW